MKQACLLCGLEDHEVQVGLVEWSAPVDGRRWVALPRCRNREACRVRVEANGDQWEVAEPEPRSMRDILRSIGR